MGLLSKKMYTCAKCGKQFEKRINLNGNLCDSCFSVEAAEKSALEIQVSGYCRYTGDLPSKSLNVDEMKDIIARREKILEKIKYTQGISRAELAAASDNYKKLTDEEAKEILLRALRSSVSSTLGAVYSNRGENDFFVLANYSNVIVDADDVFAVGFTTDSKLDGGDSEAILCAVFTNDPYIPVFPMLYSGKRGFFEIVKSKKGRAGVAATFTDMCPNLKYPVDDLKVLKKTIKEEGSVRGNIDQKKMLEYISHACGGSSIFNTKKMFSTLNSDTASMLDSVGYIQYEEIRSILKLDKMFNRKYWDKQYKNLEKDFGIK